MCFHDIVKDNNKNRAKRVHKAEMMCIEDFKEIFAEVECDINLNDLAISWAENFET